MSLPAAIVPLVWWSVFIKIGAMPRPILSVQWAITVFLYAPLIFLPHLRWFIEERICGTNQLWYTKCWMSLYSVTIALFILSLEITPSFVAAAAFISIACIGMASFSRMNIQHWPMATMLPAIFLNTLYPAVVILFLFTAAIWAFPQFAGIKTQTVALRPWRSKNSFLWHWAQSGPFLIWNRNGPAMSNQSPIKNTPRDAYNLALLLIVAFVTASLMAVSTKQTIPDMHIVGIACFFLVTTTVLAYITVAQKDKTDSLFRPSAFAVFIITATSNIDITAAHTAWLRAGDRCIPGKSPTDHSLLGMTYMFAGIVFTATTLLFRHYYEKFKWNLSIRSLVLRANAFAIISGLIQVAVPTNEATLFIARSFLNPIPFALIATAWCYLVVDACPADTRSRYTVESLFSIYILGLVAGSWVGCILIDSFSLRGPYSLTGCDFYHYKHIILTANCLFPCIAIAAAYFIVPNIQITHLNNLKE